MSDEIMTAQAETGSDINQDAIVDDYADGMNSEYLKSHQFVGEEPAIEDKPNPEEGKQEEVKKPEIPKQTVEPEKKVEGLDSKLFKMDESGNKVFDRETAFSFLNPKDDRLAYQGVQIQAQQPQAASAQPVQPEIPAWQKKLQEERAYQNNLREGALKPFKMLQEFVAQGMDVNAAYAKAQQQIQQELEDHFLERKYKAEEERAKMEEERLTEVARSKEMEASARSNELLFANNLGHDVYQQLFFSPELGGKMIEREFLRDTPDARKLTGDAYREAQAKWWVKFASDRDNLAFIYEHAKAKLVVKHLPDLLKDAGNKKGAQIKKQQLQQIIRPSGLVTKPQGKPEGERGPVEQYFNVDSIDDLT